MMTSSNGNIFHVTDHCAGNSPVTGEFPAQRPVTRSFDVFFDLRLDKQLSKQSWGWWFETQSCPLWRHCNVALCCKKRVFWFQFHWCLSPWIQMAISHHHFLWLAWGRIGRAYWRLLASPPVFSLMTHQFVRLSIIVISLLISVSAYPSEFHFIH